MEFPLSRIKTSEKSKAKQYEMVIHKNYCTLIGEGDKITSVFVKLLHFDSLPRSTQADAPAYANYGRHTNSIMMSII